MAKWEAVRDVRYVDAIIAAGDVVDGVRAEDLSFELRRAHRRRKERLASLHPDQQMIVIEFAGKIRWATAPADVRLVQGKVAGTLRRRVLLGTTEKT